MMEGEYYKTRESVEEYIRLAKDVSGIQLIERLKQVLPFESVLLEIGSGPGTDWRILNEWYHVIGSDNSTEFLHHLVKENPNHEFIELDAITLNVGSKFKGIYSNKVLQHLTDKELIASVKRQYEILDTKGVICHSFWKGEGAETFKGVFVNYYNEVKLRKAFENYFEITTLEAYNEFEDDDSLLLIAVKK